MALIKYSVKKEGHSQPERRVRGVRGFACRTFNEGEGWPRGKGKRNIRRRVLMLLQMHRGGNRQREEEDRPYPGAQRKVSGMMEGGTDVRLLILRADVAKQIASLRLRG